MIDNSFQPKTDGQRKYIHSIINNTITFATGPAGTGKTIIAVKLAVDALKSGEVNKLILCRPAVAAGEKLGFLPGDMAAKVDPYLRPIYDYLEEFLGEDYRTYVTRKYIEVAPIAFMRGRTLKKAFILMDEAQNSTVEQMKMFLTRLGDGSRMVINGDMTQNDLKEDQRSGLEHASGILRGISGLGWVDLKSCDVVRHPMVTKIVEAYDERDKPR